MKSYSFFNRLLNKVLSLTHRLWTDKAYIRFKFRLRTGYFPDLSNPKSFNEKLQWLKLNDRDVRYVNLVDKIEAKKIVSNIIGEEYIIPTLATYKTFEEIDFSSLPEKFVIKTNHDSGGVFICKNKNTLDLRKLENKIGKSLRHNYFYVGREWPYKMIKPRILVEELIENTDSQDLPDYKFMCFNGKVRCCFICLDRRSKEGLCVNFYDRDWKLMPFSRHYPIKNTPVEKPKSYEKMIELAEKLAQGFRFVRVDFYNINGKIYFGELTLYPGNGWEEFEPLDWDYKLGEWINLNQK